DRLYLFDSNGKRWRVVGVERTAASPRGPCGKLVGVSLTFGDPDQPSIDHVAEELCALVDADPDDIYAQFITHDELKTMLRAARSPGELISVAESLGAAAQQADGA
ncbi:MAG: hypothetical protein KC492_29775, partial [Myxococcales bacterium]|nr:hypothetical protein [Myxococcales bacterium]